MEAFLHLISWLIFSFMLTIVMLIARFYEKKAGQRTFYQFYFIPILLFIGAGVIYLLRGASFVGDEYGDVLLTAAGLLTIALVGYLYSLMMGRHR